MCERTPWREAGLRAGHEVGEGPAKGVPWMISTHETGIEPVTAPAVARPDQAAIKVRQQATWASGDYHMIGTQIQIVSELLIEALDVHSTERVLDVATGSGNAALAAAPGGVRAQRVGRRVIQYGVAGVTGTPKRALATHRRPSTKATVVGTSRSSLVILPRNATLPPRIR